jgi:hypothetical protein
MKKNIAGLVLATLLLMPFESTATGITTIDTAETTAQEFRLPGAPSGGYRGDFRIRVNGRGKARRAVKRSVRRTAPRPIKRAVRQRDDG